MRNRNIEFLIFAGRFSFSFFIIIFLFFFWVLCFCPILGKDQSNPWRRTEFDRPFDNLT